MNVQKIIGICFLLLTVLTLIGVFVLPDKLPFGMVKEGGPVENAQVIFYVTGALVAWIYARQKIWDGGYLCSLVLLVFAMRELDFQKKFTGISITRTKYYFHSDATIYSKLLCAVIVICIILLFFVFIKKNIKVFLQNIKTRKKWALSVVAGLIFIALAVLIDSVTRVLASLGIASVKHGHLLKSAIEELFELAIPFFFLNALLLYGNHSKKIKREEPEGRHIAAKK